MGASNAPREFLVVNKDGEVISSHLYRQDASAAAHSVVANNPGARVRIYEGRESIFSRVVVDDDMPKPAEAHQ